MTAEQTAPVSVASTIFTNPSARADRDPGMGSFTTMESFHANLIHKVPKFLIPSLRPDVEANEVGIVLEEIDRRFVGELWRLKDPTSLQGH